MEGQKEQTLCWSCKNFSKCSWSFGVPVKGWKAKPSKYYERNGKRPYVLIEVESYLVLSCPQFAEDARRTTRAKLCELLGKEERWVRRQLALDGSEIHELLKEKGYKLIVCREFAQKNARRTLYLEKI